MQDQNILKPSGKQIPYFIDKIEFVLKELGQTQSWLATEVGFGASNISQYKRARKIPAAKYKKFCKVLCISTDDFEISNFDVFKRKVREGFIKKGGIKWQAFVKRNNRHGLELLIAPSLSQIPNTSISLKGLSSKPKPHNMAAAKLQQVSLGQRIAFHIPFNKIDLTDDIEIKTHLLLLEDEEGIHYISPLKQPAIPQISSMAYKVNTENEEGFYVHEPLGHHQVHFLLLSQVLPDKIAADFINQRCGSAADQLALWLSGTSTVKFSLNSKPFFVSPR